MTKYLLLALATLVSSSWAMADMDLDNESTKSVGFFVEPMVSYEVGSSKVDYPAPLSSSDGDVNGFGLGARVGMHVSEMVFLGLDGRYAMPKFKDNGTGYNETAKSYNWGPVVGVQMPDLGLRIWAAYVVDSQIDPDANSVIDVKFNKGKGYRIGAGFRLSMVSLNLEFQDLKYDDMTLQGVGPFAPNTDFSSVNLKNQTWIASVSFPLEL